MSDEAFQAALAAVLVSSDDRALLHREPDRLRERFGLSASELRLLATSCHARIELSAWTVASKRLEFLSRALPATMTLLGARCHDPRLMEFVDRCPPREETGESSRIVAEGRRFLDYLARERPAWAPEGAHEVARFELARQTLVFSTEASVDARRCRAQQEERRRHGGDASPGDRFVLGRHVALARFGCDVLAAILRLRSTGGIAPPVPRPTAVALRKTPEGPVVGYRIGAAVHDLLAGWRSPRPLPGTGGAASDAALAAALAAARFALREGFLLTSPEDR